MYGLIFDVDGVVAVTNSTHAEKLEAADRIVSTLEEVDLQTVVDLIEQGI